MKAAIVNKIRQTDSLFNNIYFELLGERKSLVIFLFHAIFRDDNEARCDTIQPPQGITLERFCKFIEYYQSHNYTFVSPDDILSGLDPCKNYALITFDDGYFNNQYTLPVLKRYKVPALFLISTDFVKKGKAYWWDVLHREGIKRGISAQATLEKINSWMSLKTNEEIERYITDEFGKDALLPVSDLDRPLTPQELKNFAKEEFIFLGNHTSHHPYLPNCSSAEIRANILGAQNDLKEMTGVTATTISYPHGGYSDEVINITKQLGLKLGITVDDRKNYLPVKLQSEEALRLGRFALHNNDELIKQCQFCRADVRLTKIIKKFIGKN